MAESETGRARYRRQVREIQEAEGIPHAHARKRWRELYAEGGVRRVVEIAAEAVVHSDTQQRCLYCRDAIGTAEPEEDCPNCNTRYHRSCFRDELRGRCGVFGCHVRRTSARMRRVSARVRRMRIQLRPRGAEAPVAPVAVEPEANMGMWERLRVLFGIRERLEEAELLRRIGIPIPLLLLIVAIAILLWM